MRTLMTTIGLLVTLSPVCAADEPAEQIAENLEAMQGTDRWQSGYPPQLWYTPPKYDTSVNPYPPGRWQHPPMRGHYWSTPPTYRLWQPAPPGPQWIPPYSPYLWR